MREKVLGFGQVVWRYLKNNYFYILVAIVIIISFAVNYAEVSEKLIENGNNKTDIYKKCFILVSAILLGIIFFLSKKVNAKKNNYQKLFVIIAVIFGGVYLCMSPLFTGSDERSHYYRIYEVTEGAVRTPVVDGVTGGELPKSLEETFSIGGSNEKIIKYEHIPDMMRVALDKDNTMIYESKNYSTYYAAASLYSPISYVPHVIGFSIGKAFNAGPYVIGMLGRIFNLIFYILIGYFAIKITPKGKLFYLLVLISPNMLHCATVLSADAFMNVNILLFIAMIMKIRLNNEKMTYAKELVLAILSVIISLCKICYAPFIVFLFFIGKKQYKGGNKERYLFLIMTFTVAIVCSLFWLKGINGIMESEYSQSVLQKEFIISEPFGYMRILFHTIVYSFANSIECLFVGTRMYQTQLAMPAIISFIYAGIVLMATLKREKKPLNPLTDLERMVIVVSCSTVVVLVLTALYMQYTASFFGVRYKEIVGIQGRYFIPIVLCLPFVIKWKKTKVLDEKKMLFSSFAISLIVWLHMMNQFII